MKILLIAAVFLSAASSSQADDSLEEKLAKLEAASKAKQSNQKSVDKTEAIAAKNSNSAKTLAERIARKTLAERIDELEAQQKSMQQTNKGTDARVYELGRKLQALKTQSFKQQQTNEAVIGKIDELKNQQDELKAQQKSLQQTNKGTDARFYKLGRKFQALETQFKQQQTNEALTGRIPELERKVGVLENQSELLQANRESYSKAVNKESRLNHSTVAIEAGANKFPVEPPVIKATKLLSTPPFQLPDGVGFEVTADYFGKYIWRGQNLSDDPVFQPGATLTMGGLTAGFWSNLETTSINKEGGEFTEFDWSLDYSGDVPFVNGVGYSVGVINYKFPSIEDTTEVYLGFGFDLPLSPSVTVYWDVDEIKGTYASAGLGHSIENIAELGPDMPVGMDIGLSLGLGSASYNKGYWGPTVNSAKFNDLALSVSFPVEVRGWSVAPSLNYVTLVNGKVRDSDAFRSESDYFFLGFSIAKGF